MIFNVHPTDPIFITIAVFCEHGSSCSKQLTERTQYRVVLSYGLHVKYNELETTRLCFAVKDLLCKDINYRAKLKDVGPFNYIYSVFRRNPRQAGNVPWVFITNLSNEKATLD